MLRGAIGDTLTAIGGYTEELVLAFIALQIGTALAASSGVSLLATIVQPFLLAGAFVVAYRALNDRTTTREQYVDAGKERYVAVLLVLLFIGLGIGFGFLLVAAIGGAIVVLRASTILPSELPTDLTQREAVMLASDVLTDPVVIVVLVPTLAALVLLVALFQFATVAAVIDKKQATDAIRTSYDIFRDQPLQAFGYAAFKQGFGLFLVTLPNLAVPAFVLENGMPSAFAFTDPTFVILGNLLVIPTVLFINTLHVAYYQRIK